MFVAQSLTNLISWILSSLRSHIVARLFTTCHLRQQETLELVAWLRTQELDTSELDLCADSVIGSSDALERIYEYKPGLCASTRLRFYNKAARSCCNIMQWWRSQLLWIQIEEPKDTSGLRASITFLGRDPAAAEELLDEGRAVEQQKRSNSQYIEVICTYNFDHVNYKGLGWLTEEEGYHIGMMVDNKRMARPINSVVLPVVDAVDQAQAILEDCREFIASEQVCHKYK